MDNFDAENDAMMAEIAELVRDEKKESDEQAAPGESGPEKVEKSRPRQPTGGGEERDDQVATEHQRPQSPTAAQPQTRWAGMYFFCDYSTAKAKELSVDDSVQEVNRPERRTYWTDGGCNHIRQGQSFAVAWKEGGKARKWQVLVRYGGAPLNPVNDIELAGIARAFFHAAAEYDKQDPATKGAKWVLRVWTDSQHCVQAAQQACRLQDDNRDRRPQMMDLLRAAAALQACNARMELCWNPRDCGSRGIELADAFAKGVAGSGPHSLP